MRIVSFLANGVGGLALGLLVFGAGTAGASPAVRSECVKCHSYAVRAAYLDILHQWEKSVHARADVDCSGCHGGNPRAMNPDEAMYDAPSFRGSFKKAEIPALCARCHADPVRMRPYNQPTSQYDQYRQSVHGKRLLEQGDTNVAACTDCHGVHDIRSVSDPKSPVFKENIPATCAGCHADAKLMARYGIPTNQYAQYTESIHGRKVLKEHDSAAPTCADCHGTHGATPPGVTQVPEVCGHCHVQTEEHFKKGPHALAVSTVGRPRCIDCHGHHNVQFPTDQLLAPGQSVCGACHREGSTALQANKDIYQLITQRQQGYDRALALLERAEGVHMDVEDQRAELEKALTALTEARSLQHAVTADLVRDKADDAALTIQEVSAGAREALQRASRRRAALLTVGLLCVLTAGALGIRARQMWAAFEASRKG